jgi:hypothetical protein
MKFNRIIYKIFFLFIWEFRKKGDQLIKYGGWNKKKNWFEKKGTRKLLELNYQIHDPMDENGINQ